MVIEAPPPPVVEPPPTPEVGTPAVPPIPKDDKEIAAYHGMNRDVQKYIKFQDKCFN